MIKFKCDICGKECKNLDTLILYKKKIDYCENAKCKKKAYKIAQKLKKEIKCQNILYNSILKRKENELIKKLRDSTKEDKNAIFKR